MVKPSRIAIVVLSLALLAGVGFMIRQITRAPYMPSFDEVRMHYGVSESILLDRHGEIIHELRTDKGRRRLGWTPLDRVSPALREAVVQAEDRRFCRHRGVDLLSMGAALFGVVASDSLRGASTITMQLASFLDPALGASGALEKPGSPVFRERRVSHLPPVEAANTSFPAKSVSSSLARRSMAQKARQVVAARAIERNWSKEEILEAYLNLVTFRGELQGVAAASRGLFKKDPHGLDRTESLILASLIRSPNARPSAVAARATRLGLAAGWEIPADDIEKRVRIVLQGAAFVRPLAELAPHVARRLLREESGGAATWCALDGKLQRYALERLVHRLVPLEAQNVSDGAVLVVENRSGEVLAYVSRSGEPSRTRYVDGVRAKRQAGSALKPFLYALAFDRRILTPATMLEDSPLDIAVFGGIYQPRNYDSEFLGVVSARTALASSLNVPAVRALSLVGIDPLLRAFRELGIEGLTESADFYGPSLALGSADVSLWELVGAYRALADGGVWSALRLERDREPSGETRVFSREAAFLVSDILSDRDARSYTFGLENPLATSFRTAVKTGTSKDMRDNWCVGYSALYTVGVWVGNFSGEPMWNVSGMSGAAPVWIDVMSALHRADPGLGGSAREAPGLGGSEREASDGGDPKPDANHPPGLVRKRVRFPGFTEPPRYDWFIAGTEPSTEEQFFSRHDERILYPPAGTVIVVDPDIPPDRQVVFFLARGGGAGLEWRLDGERLASAGGYVSWAPIEGKHNLSVEDSEGNLVDTVEFEVRGLPPERSPEESGFRYSTFTGSQENSLESPPLPPLL
jgi:penicillin-binding protein 1C